MCSRVDEVKVACSITGKFWRPFGPVSPSSASFGVTPSRVLLVPRSIPSPWSGVISGAVPLASMRFPRIALPELVPKTSTPLKPLPTIVLPSMSVSAALSIRTPSPPFGTEARPSKLVPTRLPSTLLPVGVANEAKPLKIAIP
jgi:hypothetical protein